METVALSQYEAERGKPMPGKSHAWAQSRLLIALAKHEQYAVLSELSLQLGDHHLVPDLCVYAYYEPDWSDDVPRVTEPPLLAIEIISPSQSIDDLIKKAEIYLKTGVPACWVVLPALQTIVVLMLGQKPRYYTEGVVRDDGTGIEVPVDAIF